MNDRNASPPKGQPRPPDRSGKPGKPNKSPNTDQDRVEFTPDFGATFLNPYTFVPAHPRADWRKPLGDARPLGQDRLHDGRWTGSIKVRLTVQTPLLLLDAARAVPPESGDEGHLVHPVLIRNIDGHRRPHLADTSVKGMLRSAYEAITNSRFGVFDDHKTPLGWRRTANDAPGMRPVRVSDDGNWLEYCEAVPMRRYPPETKRNDPGAGLRHGDAVLARCRTEVKTKTIITASKTKALIKVKTKTVIKVKKKTSEDQDEQGWRFGYVFVTGRNAMKKKHERIFFVKPDPRVELTEEHRGRWRDLMRSYRDAHTDKEIYGREKGPGEWIKDDIGQLAWSPHLWDKDRTTLKPGTLCYALVRNQEVLALYPVPIPRDISARTPAEMLPDDLHPAPDFEHLSPADRVFGWVAPNGSNQRPAAYRGRLRVHGARCESTEDKAVTYFPAKDGLPLAILGQPKPAQGRFYLSDGQSDGQSNPNIPVPSGLPKEDVYDSKTRGLRGRKAYWHHARVADNSDYWNEPAGGADPTQELVGGKGYREFRRPRQIAADGANGPSLTQDQTAFATTGEEQRDSQNRSIRGWANKGTEFTLTIDVRDLDDVELGALVWLLSLPQGCFHRLGLGKPLGFGSVSLSIEDDGTALYSDAAWTRYYSSLKADHPEPGPREHDTAEILKAARTRFEDLIAGKPALTKIREAFLASAKGRDDLPVHYPRVRPLKIKAAQTMAPDPRGRSYEWFTANEKPIRMDKKTRRVGVAENHGKSLPAATDTKPGIHLYKETRQSKNNR